tara:strand:+ start:108 stop:326 length:219 start_codon:yes stop_codon:yes gene_type:complete
MVNEKQDNFGDWLITQPESFIVNCLGAEKASRFITGDLVITKFIDTTGKTYTLEDLRILEAQAFEIRQKLSE